MPIFQKKFNYGDFGAFSGQFNPFGAKQKNIPLKISLRILKNQKNRNEVRLGTLEPGIIVARRRQRRRRRRRHHDDNTLLRGVKNLQ